MSKCYFLSIFLTSIILISKLSISQNNSDSHIKNKTNIKSHPKSINHKNTHPDEYYNKALFYLDKSLDSSKKYFKLAIKEYKKVDDLISLTYTYSDYAQLEIRNGTYASAKELLFKSIFYSKKTKIKIIEGDAYYNLAAISYRRSDYGQSMQYANKAIELYQDLEDTVHLCYTYSLSMLVYFDIAKYNRAIEYSNQLINYFEKGYESDSIFLEMPLFCKAESYIQMNDFERATKPINDLKLLINFRPAIIARINYLEGLSALKKNDINKAIDLINLAKQQAKKFNEQDILLKIINAYIHILHSNHKYLKSLSEIKSALQLSYDLHKRGNTRDFLKLLSKAYEEIGNYEEALNAEKLYNQLQDSLFNSEIAGLIANYQVGIGYDKLLREHKNLTLENKDNKDKSLLYTHLFMYSLLASFILLLTLRHFRQNSKKFKRLQILNNYNNLAHVESERNKNIELQKSYEHIKYLESAKNEAFRTNKEKSRFLASMSHELRTPLNALLGYTDLLYNKENDKSKSGLVYKIRVSAESLLRVINDVLDFSSVEAGKKTLELTSVDFREISHKLESVLSLKLAQKNNTLVFNIDPDTPKYLAFYEDAIWQVLMNLLGNSNKFTFNGEIKVTVECYPNKRIKDAINLIITVNDTGIGMDNDVLQNLFTPYYQKFKNNANFEGTGLGLMISKKLIQMMKGNIHVHSALGIGTTFQLTFEELSILDKDNDALHPNLFKPGTIMFHPATILVAMSSSAEIDYYQMLFRNAGLSVISVNNGLKVMDILKDTKVDLLFTDIDIPFLKGYEISRIIKKENNRQRIPLLGLTSNKEFGSGTEASIYFDKVFVKPVASSDILTEFSLFLKHVTLKEKTSTNKEAKKASPIQETQNDPNELIDKYYLSWQALISENCISDIQQWADNLFAEAKTSNIKSLHDYSKELLDALDSFDIDAIKKTLNEFPSIIKPFKNL
ncbi:MAG: ATP-binding protein [Hyphomicrobiales bacterium]